MQNERAGQWSFWLFFIGFNVTFFPMHQLGLQGMTRRIYTYGPETGWGPLNLLATCGAGLMGISILVYIANLAWSRKRGPLAPPNPWGAGTLEWAAASPPASYNFLYLPTVNGRDALWDQGDVSPVVTGVSTKKREVLCTTVLEAAPDHRYEMAADSWMPLLLAVITGATFTGLIFDPWAFPIGACLSLLPFFGWFILGTELKRLDRDKRRKSPSAMPHFNPRNG
jgi:cytochrome c oxidase subunit 1